jgi:uncharacterized membrane protein HdeD (DUF308 family)
MKASSLQRAICFGVPAAVLAVSFAGVCKLAGTPWPWNRVVHEDGVRTLLETMFYFEHATRELLLDILLALAVAGAVRYFYPPRGASGNAEASCWRRRLGVWTAATLAVILGGAAWFDGGQTILDNLSQLHTRAGAPLVWGAHWRYHLIERVAQILLAFSVTGVLWMMDGRPDARRAAGRRLLYGGALAAFAGLTLLLHPTMESFTEPTFLGHQIRELFTHTLVTLPLALGACFELARKFSAGGGTRSNEGTWPIFAAGTVSVLCGAFLLATSVATRAQSHGQTKGLAALLFPHFFEHTLGYVLVPALAGLLYLWPWKDGDRD